MNDGHALARSDDQRLFGDTTRRFLEAECPLDGLRDLSARPGGYEPAFWRRGAELGWTSLVVPSELGGGSISDQGVRDLALVAYQFGLHAAPGPLLGSNVVAAAIARWGSPEQQAGPLTELLSGEATGAWALAEAPPHDSLGCIAMAATESADGFVLDGVKSPVEAGTDATYLLVTARTDAGLSQFLVPNGVGGLHGTPLHSLDMTKRFARLRFAGVQMPGSALVGQAGGAASAVSWLTDLAVTVQVAEMCGAMCWALDTTLEWAVNRYAFGRPLASYQELKHRFADMKLWLEASHAIAALGGRRGRSRPAEPVRAGECRQVLRGTPRHGARAGLRAAARRDRHHLRPSPASLPASRHGQHAALRHARSTRSPPDRLVRGAGGRTMTDEGDVETVEGFEARARSWLAEHMPRSADGTSRFKPVRGSDEDELAQIERSRALQRMLYHGGLAGICVPRAYGGQGLTPVHQAAFNREISGYEYPAQTQVPTLTPCMALVLEFGTEEQKVHLVPPILRGETVWMQLLSEPGGGSDLAGTLTTAVRDGDEWVLNGSKIWTTGAWWADWALCLARTNWDVPKHRGLSVFMLPIHQPGIEVHRIEMLNGSREFCQEFLTDVRVPDTMRLGRVDDGWTVAVRWMYHERTIAAGSPYLTAPAGQPAVALDSTGGPPALLPALRRRGAADDVKIRELIGESLAMRLVGDAISSYVTERIAAGAASEQWAAITRLWYGTSAARDSTIAFELVGTAAAAWSDEEQALGDIGIRFLMRQASCIAGGTTEMARNAISERVLGLPRERRVDVDVPFRDVPRGPATR